MKDVKKFLVLGVVLVLLVGGLVTFSAQPAEAYYCYAECQPVIPAVVPAPVSGGGGGAWFCWWCLWAIPFVLEATHDLLYYGWDDLFVPIPWYVEYVDSLYHGNFGVHGDRYFQGRSWNTCADATASAPVLACGGAGY